MANGYSLHVGLNRVNPASYGGWPGTLSACENDARAMQSVAQSLGYSTSLLLTEAATSRKVVAAITKAAASMVAGDIFWLTYSGHGSQVPDRNGDEASRESGEVGESADQYDETWVLYDRMLVDDELWALWSLFPAKSRIVMLSDSCHSGTVSKGAPPPWAIPRPLATAKVRSKRMPLDVEERTYKSHRRTYDAIQSRVLPRTKADVTATIALVSGCQDNQESLDGRVNSLFTAQLLKVWHDGAFSGSLKSLRELTSAQMPPSQTPNYYTVGPANRRFLSAPAFRI
ncbi:MAG: caspase family protein [Actinobacteria bacterium]|jgi:hypothetical protein|nr:caspase family protein [Actinomycetota bacterium]